MNQSKIAVRYAKALFFIALEKQLTEKIKDDILLLEESFKNISQLDVFLSSPVIKPSQKITLFSNVYNSKIHEITLNFLKLLVENKRETELKSILRRFLFLYHEKLGIKTASITTAIELDPEIKQKLTQMLASVYKTTVELDLKCDPTIIGGFVLKVDDQQYDASITTGLKRIKHSLLSVTNK